MWEKLGHWLDMNVVVAGIVAAQVILVAVVVSACILWWSIGKPAHVATPTSKPLPKVTLIHPPMDSKTEYVDGVVRTCAFKFLLRGELERDTMYDGRVGDWLLFGVKAKHIVGGKTNQVWDCVSELAVKDLASSEGNKVLSQCRILEGSVLKLNSGRWLVLLKGPLERGSLLTGVVNNVYVDGLEVLHQTGNPDLNVWVCEVRRYKIMIGCI